MDSNIVTGLAALGGSIIGGMASIAAAHLTQRNQGRRDRLMREQDMRERLYAEFIRLAADRYADSLDHTLENAGTLIELFSLVGRIHLFSTEEVWAAARAVEAHVVACYRRPIVDPIPALEHRDEIAVPLRTFTEACRRERATVLRSI
ncbi:MAG: hypothetical protein ACREE0_22395 [Phenylobacterium sp.]